MRWLPRHSILLLEALVLLALASLPVLAEGARLELTCRITQICDGAGRCTAAGDPLNITLAPEGTGAAGEGRYGVSYDGGSFEASAGDGRGPFGWTGAEGQRIALSPTGAHSLIWAESTGTVRFLNCKEGS